MFQKSRKFMYTGYWAIKDKPERLVLETESDTKELIALKQKVAELEKIIGQKQILLDFKDKMIEIAEQTYGIDIKKTYPCVEYSEEQRAV